MEPTAAALQSALMLVIADSKAYPSGLGIVHLTTYRTLLDDELSKRLAYDGRFDARAVDQALWALFRGGLAYVNYAGANPAEWVFRLTEAGQAAADEEADSPDNTDLYFERFQRKVPRASDVVKQYVREAIDAYRNMCDLAATVMMGVASEAAFLEMAHAFDRWLGTNPNNDGRRFQKELHDPRTQIKPRFDCFSIAFKTNSGDVPYRLKDGIQTHFEAVFTLLRIYRNDAGHPKETRIGRADVEHHLRMLPRYLERLYLLRSYFANEPPTEKMD